MLHWKFGYNVKYEVNSFWDVNTVFLLFIWLIPTVSDLFVGLHNLRLQP